MVLHHQPIKPIPSLTKEIAHKAFPKGNIYMTLRAGLWTKRRLVSVIFTLTNWVNL